MLIVCAWCDLTIREIVNNSHMISHGICDKCTLKIKENEMKIRCNCCGKVLYDGLIGEGERFITCHTCRIANLEQERIRKYERLVTDESESTIYSNTEDS